MTGGAVKLPASNPRPKTPIIPVSACDKLSIPPGRQLYSQRIGTVEPVFANIRHNKRLTRLNHRGRSKVNTQWNLYCMVHNTEKLAKNGYAQ
jgi:Transposase DDE domain